MTFSKKANVSHNTHFDEGSRQRRVTVDNKILKNIQIKDLKSVITDDCTVVIDSDTIPYRGAALQDKNYVVVKHKTEGWEKEFDTKTKFKGAARTEGKITQNSWLGAENLKREAEGKDLYTLDEFEIIQKKKLKEDEETAMKYIKSFIDEYISDIKFQTGCEKVLCLLGGGDNHRHLLKLPELYKSNRQDTARPVLLKEARQYLMDNYPHEFVEGREADDRGQEFGFKGFLHLRKFGKANYILAALDKDARQAPCILFDYNKKGPHWVNPNPWLIEATDKTVGELEMYEGECKATSLQQVAYQMICGDSSDWYHSYLRFPKEMHPDVSYSDASFFKDFYPLKTPKEVLQKVVDKFYDFFPKGLQYTAHDGSEMNIDTLAWLEMLFCCVYMLRSEKDKTRFIDLLERFDVDYTCVKDNHIEKPKILAPEGTVREVYSKVTEQLESISEVLSQQKGTKPVLVENMQKASELTSKIVEDMQELFIEEEL